MSRIQFKDDGGKSEVQKCNTCSTNRDLSEINFFVLSLHREHLNLLSEDVKHERQLQE